MANPLQEQQEILEELYHIVMASSPESMVSAQCRFEYDYGYDDGSASVGEEFWHSTGGKPVSDFLNRDLSHPVMGLVEQLHKLMKAHTGGEWTAFTLFIEEDGSVRTKFEYPESAIS